MTNVSQQQIGVAWYKQEQWERLLDISEDRGELEESHAEWEKNAIQKIRLLETQGFSVKKVIIDTEDLLFWCNSYRLQVNSTSRSEFVTKSLREMRRNKK